MAQPAPKLHEVEDVYQLAGANGRALAALNEALKSNTRALFALDVKVDALDAKLDKHIKRSDARHEVIVRKFNELDAKFDRVLKLLETLAA